MVAQQRPIRASLDNNFQLKSVNGFFLLAEEVLISIQFFIKEIK